MAQLSKPQRQTLRFRMGLAGIYQPPARRTVSDEEGLAILGLPQTRSARLLTDETRTKRVANG